MKGNKPSRKPLGCPGPKVPGLVEGEASIGPGLEVARMPKFEEQVVVAMPVAELVGLAVRDMAELEYETAVAEVTEVSKVSVLKVPRGAEETAEVELEIGVPQVQLRTSARSEITETEAVVFLCRLRSHPSVPPAWLRAS